MILKKMKGINDKAEDPIKDNTESTEVQEDEGPKITFEDYEKLMQKLE